MKQDSTGDKRQKCELVLDALVGSTDDAIAVMNADGTVEIWNEAAAELLGYTADEMVGGSVTTVMPDFLLPHWKAKVVALDENVVFRGASFRRHKSGRLVDVSVCARSIRDSSGQFTGYVVVLRDREKQGQQERSNELLAAIVRDSPTAISSIGFDFKVRTWNAAAENLFGYTETEIVGQDARILIPPNEMDRPGIILAQMKANKIYRFEATRVHKSGRIVAVAVVVGPQLNAAGVTTGWVLQYSDLTETLAMEAAQRSSEAFAHAVLDNSPDWITIVGRDYRISNSNRESSADRKIAQGQDWLSLWDPLQKEMLMAAFVEANTRGTAKVKTPYRLDNGHYVWFECSITLNVVTTKSDQAFIVTARDVTDQANWEKHNQLIMRELSHRAKNLLAVISAITRSTAENCSTVKEFEGSLSSRMQGLAKCHDLLVQRDWKGVGLRMLIEGQLNHFHSKTSAVLAINVADIMLGPDAAQCLSMAVHELATNSVKYGALSSRGARLEIATQLVGVDYLLTWRESGGPEVRAPKQKGFGSEVIEIMVSETFDCEARLEFHPEGVTWSTRIPRCSLNQHAAREHHFNKLDHE